jgi:glycosyl transferase family 87
VRPGTGIGRRYQQVARLSFARMRILRRTARLIAMAVALGWLGYTLASWYFAWNPADAGAYYGAAQRLLSGAPLYPVTNPEAHEVYRYAPWFAVLWIPLTLFPEWLVGHAWSLLMLAAAAYAAWPVLRLGTPAAITLGALLGAFLAETAMFGNAHPLVVAMLVRTIRHPTAPIWVGVATSLKLVPILFVVPWAGRGEWRKVAVAVGSAALLFAPILLFNLSGYITSPGTGLLSLYAVSPSLWLVVAVVNAAVAVLLAVRRSPWAWIAVALLMFLGPPRVTTSYLSFILVAVVVMLEERRTAQLIHAG